MNERTKKRGGEEMEESGRRHSRGKCNAGERRKREVGWGWPKRLRERERVGEGGDCCAQTGKDIDRLLPVWSARMNMNLKPSPTALQTTRVPSQPRLASYQYYIVSIRSECLYIDL